ncbi:MAG: MFS transporter [Gaiellales bacterium]
MSDAAPPHRLGLPAGSWAVYDFGYTLFSFVIFARYLSDWLISDLGHPDWVYTSAQAIVALSLLLLMPLAGVAADVIGKHRPLLATFTLIAGGAGALIGVINPDVGSFGVLPLLALAVISAVCTALAFAQFDPMLATVAPQRHWGVMSGIAVAAGYLGIVVWLVALADPIVGEGDKQQAFLPASVLFLVLAIPLFVLGRERGSETEKQIGRTPRAIFRAARKQQRGALLRLREQRSVVRLLMGRFLYADAIGTVNIFAVVYMSRLGGFTERDKNNVTLLVVLFAGLGALLAGWTARQFGPRRTLLSVIPVFSVGILLVAGFGDRWTVWILAPVLGTSLGTVYTVDRVFMLALTPAALRGELFGFFNLIGRVAQALGPFVLWGGVIFVVHDLTGWLSALDASRLSLVLIALAALGGAFVIRPLDDGHRRGMNRAPERVKGAVASGEDQPPGGGM